MAEYSLVDDPWWPKKVESNIAWISFEFKPLKKDEVEVLLCVPDVDEAYLPRTPFGHELVQRLFEAIPVEERRSEIPTRAIIFYNDDPDRTREQIIEWYERALVLR